MNFSFKNSIGVRFLRVVFGCYLFVTLSVTSSQLYVEYGNAEKGVLTELFNVARSFEDGLGKSLWNLDNDSIDFILNGIQKIDVISGVKITGLQEEIQGSIGLFISPKTKISVVGPAQFDDIKAREIQVVTPERSFYLYEYKLDIVFQDDAEIAPELIGHMYLYSDKKTVVQRFRKSFLLIIVIALIKTAALWLIFLYFARRVVAKPLSELTIATQTLDKGADRRESEASSTPLQTMASSENKDELQLLASSFLSMQSTILQKIENLNALNEFALKLIQAQTRDGVFTQAQALLNRLFGCRFAAIIDRNGSISWSSIDQEKLSTLKLEKDSEKIGGQYGPYNFESAISYNQDGAQMPRDPSDTSWASNVPVLTVPVSTPGMDFTHLKFFGPLNSERLDENYQINDESLSFLQVVSAIITSTLTNLRQREVIQQQNDYLEQRVAARTQELAKVNAELKHLAVHDPLTELPNRTLFNDRLNQLISLAQREKRGFAVASIDLTKFKMINDNYGHDAGDEVLVEVAKRLTGALRASDTLARMGGDEFAAILNSNNISESIDTVVEQMVAALQDPVVLTDNAAVVTSANIGISLYPEHAQTPEQLFKYADIAMYQAKREGNGYAVFDQQKSSKEKEFIQLMSELEIAISNEELRLHYQPIIDLNTGSTLGLEALVRWVHPEKGMIPPDMFIPHAEKSAHISPLTQWVLRKACEQCAKLHRQGHMVSIAVNLSPRVFTSPKLPLQLQALLDEFDLDSRWIKLEITENAAMSNPDQALSIISKFREMGSPISIDDFGTGHSSLAYLTRLPLTEIKIDKGFLIQDTPSNQLIVETIIELAHALELTVVAEGIEHRETLSMLKQKGCDAAQGYFISRPMDSKGIEHYFEQPPQLVI